MSTKQADALAQAVREYTSQETLRGDGFIAMCKALAAYERAKAAAQEHPMKCKHDIPLNLGCDKCGRYESFSQPEAKPVAADWIDSVAREFSNWLENEGCGVDLFSDCRDIVMKHAPAQDSREITARELIDALRLHDHDNLLSRADFMAIEGELAGLKAKREAKAANKTNFPL